MAIRPLSFSSYSSKPRELCPEGTFQAELIRIYYCGIQENKYNPESPQPKIVFSFELDEPMLESDGNHILSTTVTYSLHEKSGMTKLLKPALGSAYPDKPGQELDVDSLVGMKVMVTVSHTQKADRTYANIEGLARLPRGMQPFTATQDAFSWSCEDLHDPNEHKVPKWIKEFAENRIDVQSSRPAQAPAPQPQRQPFQATMTLAPQAASANVGNADDYPF